MINKIGEDSDNQRHCEMVYTYTYWLGGKIFSSHERKKIDRHLFCGNSSHFEFIDVSKTPLRWFVDNGFTELALIGRWNLLEKDEKLQKRINGGIEKIRESSEFEESHIKGITLSKDSNAGKDYYAISTKLFFTGILCIQIRWMFSCDCSNEDFNEKELDFIAHLIKGPEQTVRYFEIKDEYDNGEYQNRDALDKAEKSIGILNILSAECARDAADLFSQDISELMNLNPEIVWFNSNDTGIAKSSLYKSRLYDWKPGQNNDVPAYCNPYVGFIMDNLPVQVRDIHRVYKNKNYNEEEAINFCKQLITIVSTSPPELKKNFVAPVEYILENNISRGNSIVLVDERCTVSAGLTVLNPLTFPLMMTFSFSFECVFASSEIIGRFITELERRMPQKNYRFNSFLAEHNVLEDEMSELIYGIDVFLKDISAARVLSPCEEIITQIDSYISTRTIKNAIIALKKHKLDKRIELARNKMLTFSRLLETGYNLVSSKNEKLISTKLLTLTKKQDKITFYLVVFTIVMTLLTLFMFFESTFEVVMTLLNWLKN